MSRPTAVAAPPVGPDEIFEALDRMSLRELVAFGGRVLRLARQREVRDAIATAAILKGVELIDRHMVEDDEEGP